MENGFMNKIIGLVLVLVIGATLVGGLLVPVVDGITAKERTITNEGVFRMTDETPYSITYDPTNLAFIVNGDTIPFSEIPAGRWTIVSTDAFMFRFQAYAAENYQLFISDSSSTSLIASSATSEPRTWTFDNGTYTGYDGTTTREYTANSFRGLNLNGAYIMTNGTDKPIIEGDSSIIIGHGLTMVNANNTPFYIYGTVDNGVTVNTSPTVTVSNIAVNAPEYSGLVDCYTLNNITFTATAGENTVEATYDRVIVPYQITADVSHPLDDGQIAIFGVISLLGIVLLVTIAASAVRSKY